MSGAGAPGDERVDGTGLRVALVAARWHAEIAEALLAGAVRAVADCGAADPTVVRVSGAFELPVVAAELAKTHDAVIALGLVLRGGTPHFDYVCQGVTYGLARVALDTGKPVGFGVLTCDTPDQARDRAGLTGSHGDKGREAVLAALDTARVLRDIRPHGAAAR
ncbi:MAG: 6,7-dimethyl-8-ribityllumazine synthase [Mycobacteriales bacterium]